jgi:hypothetical protein
MRTEYSPKTTAYRICAWCGVLLGVKTWPSVWDDSTITHGVCEPCAQRVRNETRQAPHRGGDAGPGRSDPTAPVHGMHGVDPSEPAPFW